MKNKTDASEREQLQISEIISMVQGDFRLRIEEKELPDRVEEFVEYIIEHFTESELCVKGIKTRLRVCNHGFDQECKKSTGLTLHTILMNLRTETAVAMVRGSNIPLKNVHHFSGFKSHRTMARLVHKLTGTCVRKLRNEKSREVCDDKKQSIDEPST